MEHITPNFSTTISLGNLLLIATVIGSVWKLVTILRKVVLPIRGMFIEHDILWEDYNIRVGGKFRRATGRGRPLDPEEYYRTLHTTRRRRVEDKRTGEDPDQYVDEIVTGK